MEEEELAEEGAAVPEALGGALAAAGALVIVQVQRNVAPGVIGQDLQVVHLAVHPVIEKEIETEVVDDTGRRTTAAVPVAAGAGPENDQASRSLPLS